VCAHAVRVSLKSVSGVDTVNVSLEKGLASVKMKPGNKTTLKQLNDAITRNGFTMKQSVATVAGTVAVVNGKTMLRVSASSDALELLPESPSVQTANAVEGKSVLVEGTIPEAGKGKLPDSIRYHTITEEQSR
jgi:copper chaperone CopZ